MKQTIALVLSGGAARGLAHIGVIEELEKNNFEITSIAGNSMGAFIGAIYAAGKLSEFKNWILNLGKRDIVTFADLTISPQGFIKGEKIFKKLEAFLPDINIEDLPLPYVAVSADIANHKEVVFRKGSLKQAVRASIAIPAIFKPVTIGNAMLIDGGFVNPIPLNRVQRTKGDLLVGSFVNADLPEPNLTGEIPNTLDGRSLFKRFNKMRNKNRINPLKIMSKSTGLLTYSLAMANIEKHQPDILINISRHSCSNFQFHKIEQMVEIGRIAAIKTIGQLNENTIK